MANVVQTREVWVKPVKPHPNDGIPKWILADVLPREEALALMAEIIPHGHHVRLTMEGNSYVTDKSW